MCPVADLARLLRVRVEEYPLPDEAWQEPPPPILVQEAVLREVSGSRLSVWYQLEVSRPGEGLRDFRAPAEPGELWRRGPIPRVLRSRAPLEVLQLAMTLTTPIR